jgi:hypothetical protein
MIDDEDAPRFIEWAKTLPRAPRNHPFRYNTAAHPIIRATELSAIRNGDDYAINFINADVTVVDKPRAVSTAFVKLISIPSCVHECGVCLHGEDDDDDDSARSKQFARLGCSHTLCCDCLHALIASQTRNTTEWGAWLDNHQWFGDVLYTLFVRDVACPFCRRSIMTRPYC